MDAVLHAPAPPATRARLDLGLVELLGLHAADVGAELVEEDDAAAVLVDLVEDRARLVFRDSAAAPEARVATTTTHSQCDSQFQNDFKTVVDEAAAHGKPFAARDCERWLREGLGGTGALDDCVAGLRSRDASEALNGRLRRFLYRRGEAAVPYVGLVDAFALGDGRCDNNLPGDAIHFHGLLYEELTLLLETLGWRAPDGAEARDCPRAKRNWNATDR